MKARVDAGTDVAMIGAWDVSRNDSPLSKQWGKEHDAALAEDSLKGHLFFIKTGADCGGPIDVYVDEAVPEEIQKKTRRVDGEFLISVPSGKLLVGGLEDYRSSQGRITGDNSVISIPNGNYLLQCYIGEEEGSPSPSETELKKALGPEDYLYYRKTQKRGCLILLLLLLLFPALVFPFGWRIALAVTIACVIGFPHLEQRMLKHNARYQRILKTVEQTFQQAQQSEPPIFVFHLRKIDQATGLKGGSVKL